MRSSVALENQRTSNYLFYDGLGNFYLNTLGYLYYLDHSDVQSCLVLWFSVVLELPMFAFRALLFISPCISFFPHDFNFRTIFHQFFQVIINTDNDNLSWGNQTQAFRLIDFPLRSPMRSELAKD